MAVIERESSGRFSISPTVMAISAIIGIITPIILATVYFVKTNSQVAAAIEQSTAATNGVREALRGQQQMDLKLVRIETILSEWIEKGRNGTNPFRQHEPEPRE